MTCFVVSEFILLSLFNTFFLDTFYRNIKTNELKTTAKTIKSQLNLYNTQYILNNEAQKGGMCVEIFDSEGNEIIYAEPVPMGIIRNISIDDRKRLFKEAKENGTKIYYENMSTFNRNKHYNNFDNDKKSFAFNDNYGKILRHNGPSDIIVLSTIAKMNDSEVVIVLSSALMPLFATSQILNVETLYMCGVLLVVSILLSILIFRKISIPIMDINKKAMLLANGKYDIKFNSGGYKEIKELSDTLSFAAAELNKTDELRRDLMANISHDLRTPLTMIRGYAELMRDIPGENSTDNLQIIIDETNRLSNLVTDILDISQLQSGVIELNKTNFSITESIESVLLRYRHLKELEGYNIIFIKYDDVYINADAIKISQVLYNLINNAINYTGGDKTVVIRQILKNDTVRIEIEDTGDGIDDNDIKFIWDRYYKVDKTHKRAVSGTGLGLSIVKNILELHGFNYGVISRKGKGSIFYFETKIA